MKDSYQNNNLIQLIKLFPIEEYLKSKDISYQNRIGARYYSLDECPNPDCRKQHKFIINKDERYCRCFVCERSGSLIDFIMWTDGCTKAQAIDAIKNQTIYTPVEPILNSEFMNYESRTIKQRSLDNIEIQLPFYFNKINLKDESEVSRYLKNSRGYTQELIDLFDIRYSEFSKRAIFPIKDHLNRLVGWQARDITGTNEIKIITKPEGLKKSLLLYNYNAIVDTDMITIVEGPTDCHKAYQNNSVAIFGKQISEFQFNLIVSNPNLKRINIGLDKDAYKEIKNLASRFNSLYDVRIIEISGNRDFGDLNIDEANYFVDNSIKFDNSKISSF